MSFRIRAADARDVDGILALDRGVAEAPHWRREEYAALAEAQPTGSVRRCLFIAETAATPGLCRLMGFAVGKVIAIEADVSGELESVVVAEEARRMGVGRALCERVLEWSEGMGSHSVELEVRSGNTSARSFYGRLGFVEEGVRKGYYQDPADDALLLRVQVGAEGLTRN